MVEIKLETCQFDFERDTGKKTFRGARTIDGRRERENEKYQDYIYEPLEKGRNSGDFLTYSSSSILPPPPFIETPLVVGNPLGSFT